MKPIGTIATMLVLAGSVAGSAIAADQLIMKESAGDAGASYCYMKFSAIDENTLASDHPRQKPSWKGDIVDFNGPCDESPTGKDQVQEQKLQESVIRSLDFDD